MRSLPSFEIELRHFGVWRAAVATIAGLAVASILAWGAGWRSTDGGVAAAGVAIGATCAAAALLMVRRRNPIRLVFDTRNWSVVPPAADGSEPAAVELDVVSDLGAWMLLRLRAPGAGRLAATTWLPAQRLGHEPHWHALRCAVYFPRPIAGGPPAAEPDLPNERS